MQKPPILVVGSGPTGLNAALALARLNVPHRLISEATGPGQESRAMAVQARTLEHYDQFGFADEVVQRGIVAETGHLIEHTDDGQRRQLQSFNLKEIGSGLSPYPFILTFPQDDHERFLIEKLQKLGTKVEWGCKLESFEQSDEKVSAVLKRADGRTETVDAAYVAGCDGARSCVRQTLQIGFSGGTYDQLFYVADVQITGAFTHEVFFNLGTRSLTLMFPIRSSGMRRLIGLIPPELTNKQPLTFEDIRKPVESLIDSHVTQVNWFSSYRVHHRVADRFRVGRAFLAGDAGHIHSPAGGQGMNTGIGDAVNLAWKLAHVYLDRAHPKLLDSYEPERIAFARSLVSTTDRAFTGMVAPGLTGEFVRRVLAPMLFTIATRFSLSRRELFRTVSQARIHYPDSPLSQGSAGHVHGGDRLPWTGLDGPNNFVPLRSYDWQAHVYGKPVPALQDVCRELNLPLHEFGWSDGAQNAGLKQDALYLVRPDGYVGLASSAQDVAELKSYVQNFQLRFVS
jgi:2-polyprenyl-6-methoxyphenol hydroxylase-like FAD-dependent oxidoreductase